MFKGKEASGGPTTSAAAAAAGGGGGATGPAAAATGPAKLGYRSMVSVEDVPELFASLDKLIPKMAVACEAPPLYLRLRMGKPLVRKPGMNTPIMSYGKKKMKPEYWFSIPRDKADSLCRFFLLWSPDVYGDLTDADVEARGFQVITEDLEWEEPSPVHGAGAAAGAGGAAASAAKPLLKKMKIKKNSRGSKEVVDDDDDTEEETLGGVTAELAKESWEVH